jgi:hypothetical protein
LAATIRAVDCLLAPINRVFCGFDLQVLVLLVTIILSALYAALVVPQLMKAGGLDAFKDMTSLPVSSCTAFGSCKCHAFGATSGAGLQTVLQAALSL